MKWKYSVRKNKPLFVIGFACILLYIYVKLHSGNAQTFYFKVQGNSSQVNGDFLSAFKLYSKNRTTERLVKDVSCSDIFNGDQSEIDRADELTKHGNYTREFIKDEEYILLTKNCNIFKNKRGYNNYPVSVEEATFPIAYSILLYKGIEQTERLLRAIYAPQNYYCLHVDADSKQDVHDAIQGIANCFDNVFVVSRKEYIVYAGFTRLQADLNCIENLLQCCDDWKYFINLPSQEFPLKTNKEIVKILKIYNGANDIAGRTGNQRLPKRFRHRYIYRHLNNKTKPNIIETDQEKDDPPFNVTVVKGSAYGVFSRDFVYFVRNDKIARELLDWFRDVYSPDEYYWATLNYNHHIGTPGSYYKGKPDDNARLAVFAAWEWASPCHGKHVRGICVYGVGDLKSLAGKNHLFANKFYDDYQPYALDCMEEWHFNKTADDSLKTLNISFYESLPFIKR